MIWPELPTHGRARKLTVDPDRSRCPPLIMDKFLLQQQVLERLAEDLLHVEQAVRAAHDTATHEENIAENKYDTLGLEAAYLATGQARRAEAIRQSMARWRQFRPSPYDAGKGACAGLNWTPMNSASVNRNSTAAMALAFSCMRAGIARTLAPMLPP